MERVQGHVNTYFLDRKADVRSLEVERFQEASRFVFEDQEEGEEEESLQESIPFRQMLHQTEEQEDYSRFSSIKESSFLTLLSLKEPWEQQRQLESYLSPVQSDTNRFYHQALSNQENMIIPSSSSNSKRQKRKISHQETTMIRGEKRKRKRTKPAKNIEEIESQRINHIAVERNRRRQMNEHINSLRSLLPPSYIQRGDQASIVGGAIDYVKVLEQLIQSLESQKRMTNNSLSGISSNTLWTTRTQEEDETFSPKIETNVIQDHVNLKIQCFKKQGQLLKGIVSLEKLRLTVLHLNIASPSHSSVSYSFNLKMEDDCDLESADEITAAAHRIFEVR